MTRILCPEPSSFSLVGLEYAQRYSDLIAKPLSQSEFDAVAPEFDAVLVRFNTRVGAALLTSNSHIRAILSPTTGLDHLDIGAARRSKVKVYHLKGQRQFLKKISATAELTIALMLTVIRNLPVAFRAPLAGIWEPGPFRGREAAGKTMAIVGCGRLGAKVARTCMALGMKVVAFDPYVARLPAGVFRFGSLKNMLSQADIISIHVSLTPETKHIIGPEEFCVMKAGAVLINTSRGPVVDSVALLNALKGKQLAAAALDVLEDEESIMIQGSHPLINYARHHSNLIITPHIGGATYESVEKTDLFVLRRYFHELGVRV